MPPLMPLPPLFRHYAAITPFITRFAAITLAALPLSLRRHIDAAASALSMPALLPPLTLLPLLHLIIAS